MTAMSGRFGETSFSLEPHDLLRVRPAPWQLQSLEAQDPEAGGEAVGRTPVRETMSRVEASRVELSLLGPK